MQLEITEDFLMTDLAGARVILDRLRLLGIKISIDDYGTGYSSLAYLRDLPVDELKLDRAFVQPIISDPRAASIVRSTIELAHSLGLVMVAEGIEDEDTANRLLAMGCDIGQGYYFSRPQPQAVLETVLGAADARRRSTSTTVRCRGRPCRPRFRGRRRARGVPYLGLTARGDRLAVVARDRIELSTSRFSGGRSYRLSYLAVPVYCRACVVPCFDCCVVLGRSRRDSNPRPPP